MFSARQSALFALILAALAVGQTPPTSKAALSGRVTNSESQPVPGTTVRVYTGFAATPGQATVPNPVTLTDAQGNYKFVDLPAGSFYLLFEAPGYLKQAYGGKPEFFGTSVGDISSIPATPIRVSGSEEISNLNVSLTRMSTISGRVRRADGEPAQNVPVYAVRWVYRDGGRQLLDKGQDVTDDRGEYRIVGLVPGAYFIYADPPADVSSSKEIKRSIQPTFAPNSLGVSDASAVVLGGGANGYAEVRLREDAQFTVRGRILAPEGDRPPVGARILVMKDANAPVLGKGVPQLGARRPPTFVPAYVAIAAMDADGNFSIPGILPGTHRLLAFGGKSIGLIFTSGTGMMLGQGPSADDGSMGSVSVTVGDRDVDGVELRLDAGAQVTTGATIDGVNPANSIPLKMVSQEGVASTTVPDSFGNRVRSPGRYYLELQPRGLYIASIQVNGQDATRKPLELRSGKMEIAVGLRTDLGHVSGTVVNGEGKPAVGAPVSLWPVVPDEAQRTRGALFATSGQEGSVSFPSVPPGEYYMIAFEDLPDPGLTLYAPFVSQFASAGKRITVEPSKPATCETKLVGARDIERILATLR